MTSLDERLTAPHDVDDRADHRPDDRVAPVLDVVVPVHNEEALLEPSIRRLHAYLTELPFPFRITVADNASTDATWVMACRLADELDRVRVVRLPRRAGAGRCARSGRDHAAVLAYMDVDLSTDLGALLPLVAPLVSGHSDVAIGTRLARGARVVRGPKRELISRALQPPPRGTLARGSPMRSAVSRRSGPRSPSGCCRWSRTTAGSSTPSCWCSPSATGCASTRCRSTGSTTPTAGSTSSRPPSPTCAASPGSAARWPPGRCRCDGGPARPGAAARPPEAPAKLTGQLLRFAAVGVASTPATCALLAAARRRSARRPANLVALLLTAVANTAANRRLAFGVRGSEARSAIRPRAWSSSPSVWRSPAARWPRCTPGGRTRAAPSKSPCSSSPTWQQRCCASCSSAPGVPAGPLAADVG